jgi:hypothetical protein
VLFVEVNPVDEERSVFAGGIQFVPHGERNDFVTMGLEYGHDVEEIDFAAPLAIKKFVR